MAFETVGGNRDCGWQQRQGSNRDNRDSVNSNGGCMDDRRLGGNVDVYIYCLDGRRQCGLDCMGLLAA